MTLRTVLVSSVPERTDSARSLDPSSSAKRPPQERSKQQQARWETGAPADTKSAAEGDSRFSLGKEYQMNEMTVAQPINGRRGATVVGPLWPDA